MEMAFEGAGLSHSPGLGTQGGRGWFKLSFQGLPATGLVVEVPGSVAFVSPPAHAEMSEVRPGSRDLFQEAPLEEQVPELSSTEIPGLTRATEDQDGDQDGDRMVDLDLMECLEHRWVPVFCWLVVGVGWLPPAPRPAAWPHPSP